jgi:hypothetical protein
MLISRVVDVFELIDVTHVQCFLVILDLILLIY